MLDKSTLQTRFGEHCRRVTKPKNIDTFLYQHFKHIGHFPHNVIVQPVEKISYDSNSSTRFKNFKRFKIELFSVQTNHTRYSSIGYNFNVTLQSACLAFNPIMVDNFAAFFSCTPVGRASDTMMAPT